MEWIKKKCQTIKEKWELLILVGCFMEKMYYLLAANIRQTIKMWIFPFECLERPIIDTYTHR